MFQLSNFNAASEFRGRRFAVFNFGGSAETWPSIVLATRAYALAVAHKSRMRRNHTFHVFLRRPIVFGRPVFRLAETHDAPPSFLREAFRGVSRQGVGVIETQEGAQCFFKTRKSNWPRDADVARLRPLSFGGFGGRRAGRRFSEFCFCIASCAQIMNDTQSQFPCSVVGGRLCLAGRFLDCRFFVVEGVPRRDSPERGSHRNIGGIVHLCAHRWPAGRTHEFRVLLPGGVF